MHGKGDMLAALLVPKKGEGEPDGDEGGEHSAAMADFIDAVKAGDAAGASQALETCILDCMSKYGPEKDESAE